jgi:peptide/nickel transport system ATP-binding protein
MDDRALLEVTGLRTHFATREGLVRAVDGVDFVVPAGKTVCVVGESGCGKSVTARSVLGLVDPPGRIVDGSIRWRRELATPPVDLAALDPRGEAMRRIRGAEISMVFQEPMASLSPMYTIGQQLVETIRLHLPMSRSEARDHAVSMLRRVGIPRADQRIDAYSFQLSGGMCQRAMIAIALACGPSLLIADEPTTALDVTTQARILDLIAGLQAETGMSVLFITHDLGVVAEVADEVVVMYLGTVVERGSVQEIFAEPRHPYTRALLRSVPRLGAGQRRLQRLPAIRGMVPHPSERPGGCPFHPRCDHAVPGRCDTADPPTVALGPDRRVRCVLYIDGGAGPEAGSERVLEPVSVADRIPPAAEEPPLLDVRGLVMRYPIRTGMFGRTVGHVQAVSGVDLAIRPGETLGLVGESGCGKTTLGRCIVRAIEPVAGEIHYRRPDGRQVDVAYLPGRQLRRYQREVRLVFQDPFTSLNPRMTLLQIVGDPLRTAGLATGSDLEDRVAETLRLVGLQPGYMRRYPHAFSGGERQRVNIARALISQPRLVVADEPVSALDVSVRAQILNLLRDLQDRLDLTYLFISHDLSVVESICDRVAVMYLGRIVELADTADLFARPRHPYTEALLSAVPAPTVSDRPAPPYGRRPDPRLRKERRVVVADEVPDPADPPPGCPFHTRCRYVEPAVCGADVPALREVRPAHLAACHYSEDLTLTGVRSGVTA